MSMFQHFDWAKAVLALGSNVGDRLGHLQAAVDLLDAHENVDVIGVSPVYETDPVGGPDQGPFLNAVVEIRTLLDPRDLLALAHELENARGRLRGEQWGPRTLDVDIVTFASFFMETSALTLPHPLAGERAFVLAPWYDLDPDAELPRVGPVRALLEQVPRSGVRRRDDLPLLFVGAVDPAGSEASSAEDTGS
jgi:2-amino-4-hydroxy-6-hydroxymethyldihydropteridine diphosphokinase